MSDAPRVQPTAYRPPVGAPSGRRRWLRPLPLVLAVVLLVLGGTVWFVFTAQAVRLEFRPTPDTVAIAGGVSLPVGERYLLRPGDYRVTAGKVGYHRLEQMIEVVADDNPPFTFELQKLPGRLRVLSQPGGARVEIDGEAAGNTPLEPVELEPGAHAVTLRAERYQMYSAEVEIEGKDQLQTLEAVLTPDWAPVTVSSDPAGATLMVDGEARGTTPVTAEIAAGRHDLALRLDGYEDWNRQLDVVADQPQELDTVQLARARGRLKVATTPAGASVRVGDEYRGRTPVTVTLTPDEASAVRIAKAGYRSVTREVRVGSGERRPLTVELTPILGTVEVQAEPADATIYVDGQAQGAGSQSLQLTATEHRIAVRKDGYVEFETTVTPKPGLAQTVEARLLTEAQAHAASLPRTIQTPAGGRLQLIQPGRFTAGARRREQGARANEVRRPIKLTRAFYMGIHEVTNEQFRKFRSGHSSGIVARKTLDNDDQPVVRVSWADAVAYCNWLSRQEGLPEAYQGGELVTPVQTGYRLPTEAEWAWAARFAGGRNLKYPWGNSMPPTGPAGNYADTAAADLLGEHLSAYQDGYVASAPVGRFAASALGLFDIGGNVAEWTHDRYSSAPGAGALEIDPTGPDGGGANVARGSSWRHGRITELRLSYRESAADARDDLGFRVVRYAE